MGNGGALARLLHILLAPSDILVALDGGWWCSRETFQGSALPETYSGRTRGEWWCSRETFQGLPPRGTRAFRTSVTQTISQSAGVDSLGQHTQNWVLIPTPDGYYGGGLQ